VRAPVEEGELAQALEVANDDWGGSEGLTTAEVGEACDSESGEEDGRDEDTDDGDGARHGVLEDDDVGDEEWKAIDQEQAAGGHRPTTGGGAIAPERPPRDAVYDRENGRQAQDELAHDYQNDAGRIGMDICSVRKWRLKEVRENREACRGEDDGGVSETSAQNLEFVHRELVPPGWGISRMYATVKHCRCQRKYGVN